MLDVLHYYFEEDNRYSSEEAVKSKSKTRESLYGDMYGVPYKYKYKESNSNQQAAQTYDLDDWEDLPEEDIKPFDPLQGPPKAYVPPTDYNPASSKPFGNVLDAPLG